MLTQMQVQLWDGMSAIQELDNCSMLNMDDPNANDYIMNQLTDDTPTHM
jgi:hypothetical protein